MDELSNEQLVQLIQLNPKDKKALETLFFKNLGMIKKVCRKYTHIFEMQELINQSYFAFIKAVEEYRPDKSVQFITYLTLCVSHEIASYVAQNSHAIYIPPTMLRNCRALQKFIDDFRNFYMRSPTNSELVYYTDASEEQINTLLGIIEMQSIQSLDQSIQSEDDNLTLADTIPSDENIELNAVETISNEAISKVLDDILHQSLSPEEIEVVKLHYYNDLSIHQIADRTGQTDSDIRRIKRRAMGILMGPKIRNKIRLSGILDDTSKAYNGGYRSFIDHQFTSIEEYIVSRII